MDIINRELFQISHSFVGTLLRPTLWRNRLIINALIPGNGAMNLNKFYTHDGSIQKK